MHVLLTLFTTTICKYVFVRDLSRVPIAEMPLEIVKHIKALAKQNTVMHQVVLSVGVPLCSLV